MEATEILRDLADLPPEARQQVVDFIAFLKERYARPLKTKRRRGKLTSEPFIGMWRERVDMQDSASWVRQVRRSEWGDQP